MNILVTAVGGEEGVLGWQPQCLAPRQLSSGSCRIWRLPVVSQCGVARALKVPRALGVEGSPGARLLAGNSLGFGWCTTYYSGFGEMTHVLAPLYVGMFTVLWGAWHKYCYLGCSQWGWRGRKLASLARLRRPECVFNYCGVDGRATSVQLWQVGG